MSVFDKAITPKITYCNDFKITNFVSNEYIPKESLQDGLIELIIFPDKTIKKTIPNSSVWVYKKNTKYKPELLKTAIGCGITLAGVNIDINNFNLVAKIIKILKQNNIKFGKGEHFLSVLSSHPKSFYKNSFLLHSDMNLSDEYPTDYLTALEYMKKASKKRIKIIKIILDALGEKNSLVTDWTHNSIEILDDRIIYRKGAINLEHNDNIGLLALNSYHGIYLYAGENPKLYYALPHALGKKINEETNLSETYCVVDDDYYTVYDISKSKMPSNLMDIYYDFSVFLETFRNHQFQLIYSPICKPKYVILQKEI